MKKLVAIMLSALFLLSINVSASSAWESVFGGNWRTRAYTNQNFLGEDRTEASDWTVVDTRIRLSYTAILNDNLKFVNQFEFNGLWGNNGDLTAAGGHDFEASWTDFGADGTRSLRIKHSYADFNIGQFNAVIGVQPIVMARGFLLDDDFAAAAISFNGDNFTIPFYWLKAYEGGFGFNARDVDFYALAPSFSFQDKVTMTPYFLYAFSENARNWVPTTLYDDLKIFYAGLDLDVNFDPFSFWMTGLYMGGSADLAANPSQSDDFKAWLGAVGASANFGKFGARGQFFYATGDDPKDKDRKHFFVPSPDYTGQSYYWAEIMGYGIFDEIVSNNAPGDKIGNIMAGNFGVTFTPTDKLSVALDGWYARLAEDVVIGGQKVNELGVEVDLTVSYHLVSGLAMDFVAAYLFAGDVTTEKNPNEADPYELGVQLSFEF